MFPNFVLLILINAQQEVLLLRRINTPFCNNCYALPGGKIEQHESAKMAMIREAKNSLGLEIIPAHLHFVHCMSRKCNEAEFISCSFQLTEWNIEPSNMELNRHDDMEWFPINKLPENIVPAHRYTIEMISKNIFYSEHGWDELP